MRHSNLGISPNCSNRTKCGRGPEQLQEKALRVRAQAYRLCHLLREGPGRGEVSREPLRHAFCNTCVGSYVAAKISENVAVIGCPDPECKKGLVQIDQCRSIIPSELFDRWNVALCEDVGGGDKLYCPFKDCSVLLSSDGAAEIRETECPQCHRLFCASCRVPWHHGIRCKEFQKLGDDERGQDDLTLRNLANEKWSRCPKCKMYVERIDGCVYIVCRYLLFHCFICSPNILLHREQLQWTSFFIKFSGAGTASATSADPR
jgi:E3 ubiquitin-protein ligase RNF144